jgi:hypothetical protein
MSISLIEDGRRIYFAGDTFAARDRIKSMGGKWDPESRRWWVGSAKSAKARELVAELAHPTTPRAAASAGLDPSTPAGIVADRLEETGHGREAASVRAGRDIEDPDKVRLTGKGTYKGKTYYISASTRDGSRVRLLTLPDAAGKYLDFWANSTDVEVTKRYEVRTRWNGRYGGSSRQLEQYTTLGSIARFLRQQAEPGQRRGRCTECDAWGPVGEPCRSCGGEGTHV